MKKERRELGHVEPVGLGCFGWKS
jgi:hypothetical protein